MKASRSPSGSALSTSARIRSVMSSASATLRFPASVTAITRARRSRLDGRRSASPPASSSSRVTTMVVLSSPTMRASSVCVWSPLSAAISTACARGEMPRSSSAAVISVVSV
jgi:hypothetical protein